MATVTDRVADVALSLPVDARLSLVEKLLTSLNLPVAEQVDRMWAEEAEHRITQLQAGKAKLVPGEVVFLKIRSKHEKP
jgi:putative addiction module component (TIGR02574 family)